VGFFGLSLLVPILDGLRYGLFTAFLLGPVFFTLLKNATQFGRNAGISTAIGIIVSDILVIIICFLATAPIIESIKTEPLVKYTGAAILLFMGLRFAIKPSVIDQDNVTTKKSSNWGYFIQGFLVNGVNPFVFIVWIGFITIGKNNYEGSNLYIYLTSILAGIFITDVIKSSLADRIRPYLKPVYLKTAYRVIGIILILFALRLVYLAIL
jgi:threonine/homoserine/homoserine lactone efflux protein